MRKFIIFSVLIFSFLAFSKTLLVPEEFLRIQQAVVSAQNGDTVSVNFGRVNGQRTVVSGQQIMGKEIAFELRGEGKEVLSQMIREMNNSPSTDNEPYQYPPPGWQGQRIVNQPDTFYDGSHWLTMDITGHPWVVWIGEADRRPGIPYFSKWDGQEWEMEKEVVVRDSVHHYHHLPSLAVDDFNNGWFVWSRDSTAGHGADDIFFNRWNEITGWEEPRKVNLYDSSEVDFWGRIAIGGGEIWVVWYGGPDYFPPPYNVYVSRWDGNGWEPETQISPPDSGLHWDVNIVVDNNGRPHIVWDEAWYSEYVYYATKTDTGWSITHVNNPSSVRAGPWCCPSIDIDDSGYIYIVWTGVKQGDSDRDVFLVKGDGRIWNEPIQINQDDNYNEYYAFVAAKSSNDIWVSWTKEFSFWVTHVYVSHFDGMGWSQEERLDTSPPSCNGVGIIKLDARDLPWVVWEGIDTSSTFAGSEIYYNRYLSSGIIEEGGRKNRDSHSVLYVRPNPISDRATISYTLTKPSFVKLEIFDVQGRKVSTLIESFKQAGNYRMLWDTSLKNQKGCLSAKIFFCRFQAEGKIKTLKVVFKKR